MPKRKRDEAATTAWEIRGFSRAGGGLRTIKSPYSEPNLGTEIQEFISWIYGGTVWEGNTPLFHFTVNVGLDDDPRAHPTYQRVAALCSFGAAVQHLVAAQES